VLEVFHSDLEVETFLKIFKSIPKSMSTSLARESHYNLKDFYNSKSRGIDKFSLVAKRSNLEDSELV
tara:strand:+ start:110 stop:310 length:201 start_codon:yes stop_codon:yes gene_type:complete